MTNRVAQEGSGFLNFNYNFPGVALHTKRYSDASETLLVYVAVFLIRRSTES